MPPSSLSVAVRAARLALPVFMLLSFTGCEKSRQLSADTATASQETARIQAELELKRKELEKTIREYDDLRTQPANRANASGNLEAQVKVLTDRKNVLESEVASLRAQQEAYRKANP